LVSLIAKVSKNRTWTFVIGFLVTKQRSLLLTAAVGAINYRPKRKSYKLKDPDLPDV